MPMGYVTHDPQVPHVPLVPDASRGVGILVGFGMDGAEFREHDPPAALGLHPAQMGLSSGSLGSGPRTVRGLPKSIAGLPGTDLDRFEQHIVLRVSGHDFILILTAGNAGPAEEPV